MSRVALTIALAASLMACATQRSTRMTVADFSAMAFEMAQSLARSDALISRTPGSPRWVVAIDRVTNLSDDVMTPSEQWYIVARLRSELPMQALSQQRNLAFVIPAEQARRLRDEEDLETFSEDFASQRRPTHQMNATFRSLQRASALAQTDTYYCEFELIDLATGVPAWTDRFEYKRSARGHVWD